MAVSQKFPNGRSLAKVVTALGVLLLLSLAACGKSEEKARQAAAAPRPRRWWSRT